MADIKRIETGARMSRAVIHNGVAYLAGTTAAEKTPDIRAQTRDVLQRIDKRLAEVGTDKSRLLTAQCELAAPDILVEIIVTAAI